MMKDRREGPMTAEYFAGLTAFRRGYAVYWFGENKEEPNVPDESNPYPPNSEDASRWDAGQFQAMLDAQDSEE